MPKALALQVSIFSRIYEGSKQFLNNFQKSIANLFCHLLAHFLNYTHQVFLKNLQECFDNL